MPEIVLTEQGKKYFLIDEYFKTFLIRDIFERYKPRQESAIRDLIKILLNSNYCTISKLTNTLKSLGYKIGKGTISNYLNWLENSFFVHFLQIYSPNIKNQLQCPKKPYFIDNFFISRFSSKFSKNLGRLLENLVAQRLLKKASFNPLLEIYYWKNYQQEEVDFIVKQDLKVKQLIQVCYDPSDYETKQRELKSLIKASKELNCSNLLVITSDYEAEEKVKNKKIKFISLWKWLLTCG